MTDPIRNLLITPPPELVKQWLVEGHHQDYCSATNHAIAQAARWGADRELDECVKWMSNRSSLTKELHSARRPKPPSLAEEALTKIDAILGDPQKSTLKDELEALELSRAALERLKELEGAND